MIIILLVLIKAQKSDAAHPTIVRLRQNCSLSHHQNKPWYCIQDRTKMDLITADNGVSADGGSQGALGVRLLKSLMGEGFFLLLFICHLCSLPVPEQRAGRSCRRE